MKFPFLSSLTNRIFLATAALAVLAIGFAVYFVSVRVVRDAEDELSRGLVEAGKLVKQHRATLVDTFRIEAQLIADLPKLKAAVETGDPPTVEPIARDYQARVGSDLFVVTDRNGHILSAVGMPLVQDTVADMPGIKRALAGTESSNFWPQSKGVLQVITVPISIGVGSPEILGSLSVGFLFDDQLAAQFKNVTDSEVAFAVDGEIRAATVDAAGRRTLAALLGSKGVRPVELNGDEYVALVEPLLPTPAPTGPANTDAGAKTLTGEPPALGPELPAAIILRSRTDRLRFLNGLFAGLAGAALLAVLLAIGISYGVARTVTRPLAAITAAMREVAATGDLTRKIDVPGHGNWHDEDTSLLARTFNTLTDSVARFQREAAQRERLSSLGRLSTVIAHEIRNPLMIIKASLRTIRREDVTTTMAREAAADIDEEVGRLNRIVNAVLDFARPIRFDLTPTDVNALCEECAAATSADGHGPAITVVPDPSLTQVVTDADRLRIVLVNLLVNARHAVVARWSNGHTPPAELPDIEVRISHSPSDQIVIVMSDQGGGITAEDLPRVFDPYFTTKRTGTGLGLAISKNIVEGLGGTITVDSQPGKGTKMRIELPGQQASGFRLQASVPDGGPVGPVA
jgi:signal transduction histidine kinase